MAAEGMGEEVSHGGQEVVMGMREQDLGCWQTWSGRKGVIGGQIYPKPPFLSRRGSGFRGRIWVFFFLLFFFSPCFTHMQI